MSARHQVGAAASAERLAEARRAIVRETTLQATAGMDGLPVRSLVRRAHAVEQLAAGARDFKLCGDACSTATNSAELAAGVPGGSIDDLAAKLALLVSRMARTPSEDREGSVTHGLAVSALVDAVLLRDGPLPLPHGATDPVADAADAERWCRRASVVR